MIDRSTLIIQTTCFTESDRGLAGQLGADLYNLLTRPKQDPLAWGPGIPVRVAAQPDRIDVTEGHQAVIAPVLGGATFADGPSRAKALSYLESWTRAGARVVPILVSAAWRAGQSPLPASAITVLDTGENGRRAMIDAIVLEANRLLSGDDATSSCLFISHARGDGEATGRAAEKIRSCATSDPVGAAFFNKVWLVAGEDLISQLDDTAEGVFLAVRGDLYSSRAWCRRALLRAKQQGIPTLTVEVLSLGESRSAAYAGNGPTAVWNRTSPDPAREILTRAMAEAVRHRFFLKDSRRVIEAAELPAATQRLSRPPELLDLAGVRSQTDAAVVLLHPDPPLPVFERDILAAADKRLRLVTPTTAFSGAIGSSIRAPLDGWQVALSLANPSEAPDAADPEGVTAEHLTDATMFLSRALVGVGAALAYGGDFRSQGFTRLLAQMVLNYNETARRPAEFLHGYLPATVDPADGDLAFTAHGLRDNPDALLSFSASEAPVPAWRAALHLSDMRRVMALRTRARIAAGGATIPRSHDPKGYTGRFPGVAEEVWWSLKAGKPVYLMGGFGGATRLLVEAITAETPAQLDDRTWAGNAERDAFVAAFAADPDARRLDGPPDLATLTGDIRRWMSSHLQDSVDSPGWNGLTADENQSLFATKDPLTVAALVLKGLLALSSREADGKLRIELVEGSVTEATDLELLVFPTFTDLGLNGAGAALDRRSGGAATRARNGRNPVPAGSPSLGADFLYAADLGPMTSAVRDIPASVAQAAGAAAHVIRRHGFRRTGVVTFMGNVAADLAQVVNAMVAGLLQAAGTTEIVWFESDPLRATLLASILAEKADVVLTRRVSSASKPAAQPSGARRTVIAVRQDHESLDVTLLLDRANGLAPVLRSAFSDADRDRLAGGRAQSAPSAAELAKRGSSIAGMLFGVQANRVLEAVSGSQLVVMHDASASGIPYEAMAWSSGGRTLTPATDGGIIRHLLVPGLPADGALPRPPRAGKLGVLVVINPTGDLDGAEEEGRALLKELAGGPFEVTPMRGGEATVQRVKQAIADPQYDVFHYCGHAFFKEPGPRGSGLNCADGPLTLEALRGVGAVPRLAFVNACQAGRVRDKPVGLVEPEAFAEFFLRAGVDAYLGTFWLVSDKGAATFAAKVYAELAAGRELGRAVVEGRRTLQGASNSDWANYVLYGDAGFRLVQPASSSSPEEAPDRPPPAATMRVDDRTIVAAWNFDAADAPSSFAVIAVDARTGSAVPLERPVRVERRESWSGPHGIVTWIATLRLRELPDHDVELRPTSGERLRVSPVTSAPSRSLRSSLPPGAAGAADPLLELRRLMDQQADGGDAILRKLQPSADPGELAAAIDQGLRGATGAAGPTDGTRMLWPLQALSPPAVDPAALVEFCAAYGIPEVPLTAAQSMLFQTKEDWFRYLKAPGAVAFTRGDDVLAPLWRAAGAPAQDLTCSVRDGEAAPAFRAALFSDNGNGLHASLAIADQIRRSGLAYAFHLGDVYYGGSPSEFRDYFEQPLAEMFDRTELFMIAGNHEMFAKGEWYQDMIRRKAKRHPERQRQSAEMFRLVGPGFQILGVDTMFVGWSSGQLRLHDRADRAVLNVLEAWLAERPDDLTILLTTNEPWDKGSKRLTPLYQSLRQTIAGRVDLWFWGNVHYGALYEPWAFDDSGAPARRLIGSCIGHGGYPFYTQARVGDLPDGLHCRWLETKSRFWPDTRIRPDVGANGWCRLEMQRSGSAWTIVLTYLDWVGRERLIATLSREDGRSVRFVDVKESDAPGVGAPLSWREVPEQG